MAAVEAGAHAWASRDGVIRPLSQWTKDSEAVCAAALNCRWHAGIGGGATRVHPGARAALKLMNVSSSKEFAQIMAQCRTGTEIRQHCELCPRKVFKKDI